MGTHPSLSAHGAAVTDIEFLPFHHDMLLTASEDTTVFIVNFCMLLNLSLKQETLNLDKFIIILYVIC